MTIGALRDVLTQIMEAGVLPQTEIAIAADPEGNEFYPLSRDTCFGRLEGNELGYDAKLNDGYSYVPGDTFFLWPE